MEDSERSSFPKNLSAVSEEQGESFHQDIKEMKQISGPVDYQRDSRLGLLVDAALERAARKQFHMRNN